MADGPSRDAEGQDKSRTAPHAAVLGAAAAAGPSVPDRRLLEFLVCPVMRGPLQYDARHQELISRGARLAYPIRDGIAILVPDEARHLDDPRPPS